MMGTIDEFKPPLMIRIPTNARTEGDAVYLDRFVVGMITPLCPEGFMETVSANIVTLCRNEEIYQTLLTESKESPY